MNRIISSLGLSALLAVSAAAGAANRDSQQGGQSRPRGVASQERGQPPRQSANNQNRRNEGRDSRYDGRNDQRDYRSDNRYERRDQARERFNGGHYQPPRGYYHRQWNRGDRLPAAYYSRPYVIQDYPRYRLYPPPRGYQWVRVNSDVVLTAIATGIVLDVLYGLYY